MRAINDPFIASYPSIDLHGLDRQTAIIKIREFIYDSKKMGNYNIILIHGKGTGILRRSIHEYLRRDNQVETFYLYNFNDGITIVKIIN